MVCYRNSRFHNAKNGMLLMKLLRIWIWFMPNKKIIKEINGIKFDLDLDQEIDSSLYFSNTFEPLSESILERFVLPGMTTIDIGANIGYHTFHLAKLTQPDGGVYAIEPTSWAIERLRRNAILNSSLQNIKIFQIAFSDSHKGITESIFKSSYALNGNDEINKIEKTYITTMDDFIDDNNIKRVDFIKMDVDGFEGKIIRGMKKTMERDHPIILFEITPSVLSRQGINPREFLMEFINFHYSLYSEKLSLINHLDQYLDQNEGNDSSMILAYPGTIQ